MRILERAHVRPNFNVYGLADSISPGRRTEEDIRYLLKKGYLRNKDALQLTEKGLACIDSSSPSNRMKRVGKGLLLFLVLPVLAVMIGNWLWDLIQATR